MKLPQRDVAPRLGVRLATIHTWEANDSTPEFRYMPEIMEFLAYNPLPPATT